MFGLFKSKQPKTINFDQADHNLYGKKKLSREMISTDELCLQFEREAQQHIAELQQLAEKQVDPLLTAEGKKSAIAEKFSEMCQQEREIESMIEAAGEPQRHQDQLLQALETLTDEVRRGNTVANMTDLAKAHPFLSGFLATHAYYAIKSK